MLCVCVCVRIGDMASRREFIHSINSYHYITLYVHTTLYSPMMNFPLPTTSSKVTDSAVSRSVRGILRVVDDMSLLAQKAVDKNTRS